jgi:hypothetical protein
LCQVESTEAFSSLRRTLHQLTTNDCLRRPRRVTVLNCPTDSSGKFKQIRTFAGISPFIGRASDQLCPAYRRMVDGPIGGAIATRRACRRPLIMSFEPLRTNRQQQQQPPPMMPHHAVAVQGPGFNCIRRRRTVDTRADSRECLRSVHAKTNVADGRLFDVDRIWHSNDLVDDDGSQNMSTESLCRGWPVKCTYGALQHC